MNNQNPLLVGSAIAMLLVLFGLVGRLDYEDQKKLAEPEPTKVEQVDCFLHGNPVFDHNLAEVPREGD